MNQNDSVGIADVLDRVWGEHRSLTAQRLEVLRAAVVALENGELPLELRTRAAKEAHKLAGSLGTFGLPQGTDAARTLEDILENRRSEEVRAATPIKTVDQVRATFEELEAAIRSRD